MWKTSLKRELSCAIEMNRDLSRVSTLGVGGRGEFFAEPSELEDVCALFRLRRDAGFPLWILGGGTNVVFTDGELEGVILSTRRMTARRWIESDDDAVLEAEAGYLLSLIVKESSGEGFSGAEFALGIPGTVGGAVAGNAGAGGRSIGELLDEVTTVENDGSLKRWKRGEFDYAYRYFSPAAPDRLIASCKLRFKRAPRADIDRAIAEFRRVRSIQPQGKRSAGCAFKNPPGDSAGRLLDFCGCKGLRVGGAEVSEAHANFILNVDRALGDDIFELMELCRDIVFQKAGVRLEPEIKLVGFRRKFSSLPNP
ncbi:MAG: UDP-N-acetylmuramate dehydrogenase [Synergistaceae bacterium]|jgi:UDP-N-acetylmuramate dehydrogenase|nr:UDP-N-acetylmuramate dehydrogenase [Synergistaceae bacterium]